MLELFLGIGALVATVITANKLRTIGKTKEEKEEYWDKQVSKYRLNNDYQKQYDNIEKTYNEVIRNYEWAWDKSQYVDTLLDYVETLDTISEDGDTDWYLKSQADRLAEDIRKICHDKGIF